MSRLKPTVAVAALIVCACHAGLDAKPLEAPTWEAAVQAPWIVIAEYQGYDEKMLPKDSLGFALAEYRVTEVLRGEQRLATIRIHYDFCDGSACIPEEGWKFSDKLMPAKGSKWLLFLRPGEMPKDVYLTYRGNFGRKEASAEHKEKVRRLLRATAEK